MPVRRRLACHDIMHAGEELVRREGLYLPLSAAVVKAGKHKQIADDSRHSVAFVYRHAQKIIAHFGRQRRTFQHGFRRAAYTLYRRAKLMRNIGDKFPAGFIKLISLGDIVDNTHDTVALGICLGIAEIGEHDIERLAVIYDIVHAVIAACLVFVGYPAVIYIQHTYHLREIEIFQEALSLGRAEMEELFCHFIDMHE